MTDGVRIALQVLVHVFGEIAGAPRATLVSKIAFAAISHVFSQMSPPINKHYKNPMF
jgi:hypothetical protein